MSIFINSNQASITAQRSLAESTRRLERSVARLSSGLRINTGADDPAGLAISDRLKAQIRSYQQAQRNGADAASLSALADGQAGEITELLVRMRELAVEALNGTTTTSDREALDEEYQDLIDEIDRIAKTTEFNGINLLDGTVSSIEFQIGIASAAADRIKLSLTDLTVSSGGLDVGSTTLDDTAANIQNYIDKIDTAIDEVSKARSKFGGTSARVDFALSAIGTLVQNLSAAESRIRDLDIAAETAEFARNQLMQEAGVAVLAQANSLPEIAISLLRF